MNTIIEVKDLVKKYKKAQQNAVDGISFSVAEGEFFALLGPNGAGKTTTISILTTMLAKTSGEVKINGFDLEKDAQHVRRNIGIIFQNPSLDLNLTAEENVRLHCLLYGLYPFRPSYSMMPLQYQKKVQELATVLGIQKEIFQPVKTFSGGMKRKLEIIRSLMHNPKVLFLDEPTTGLDPVSRQNLWVYLDSVRKSEKITIFLTTHYLEEAEGVDHLCVINNGRIVASGTPQHIKRKLTQEYLLLAAHDKDKLIGELQKLDVSFEEEDHLLKVIPGKQGFQQIISKIKTPLTVLKTHSPTLEEAYVEIIKES